MGSGSNPFRTGSRGGVTGQALLLLGGKALLRDLQRLDLRNQPRAMNQAVRFALNPVRKAVRSNIMSKVKMNSAARKQYADSIGISVKSYKRSGVTAGKVAARDKRVPKVGGKKVEGFTVGWNNWANLSHLFELGVGSHQLPKKLVEGVIINDPWTHPGTPPQPHLRPSLDDRTALVVQRYSSKLQKVINKIAAKSKKS